MQFSEATLRFHLSTALLFTKQLSHQEKQNIQYRRIGSKYPIINLLVE